MKCNSENLYLIFAQICCWLKWYMIYYWTLIMVESLCLCCAVFFYTITIRFSFMDWMWIKFRSWAQVFFGWSLSDSKYKWLPSSLNMIPLGNSIQKHDIGFHCCSLQFQQSQITDTLLIKLRIMHKTLDNVRQLYFT